MPPARKQARKQPRSEESQQEYARSVLAEIEDRYRSSLADIRLQTQERTSRAPYIQRSRIAEEALQQVRGVNEEYALAMQDYEERFGPPSTSSSGGNLPATTSIPALPTIEEESDEDEFGPAIPRKDVTQKHLPGQRKTKRNTTLDLRTRNRLAKQVAYGNRLLKEKGRLTPKQRDSYQRAMDQLYPQRRDVDISLEDFEETMQEETNRNIWEELANDGVIPPRNVSSNNVYIDPNLERQVLDPRYRVNINLFGESLDNNTNNTDNTFTEEELLRGDLLQSPTSDVLRNFYFLDEDEGEIPLVLQNANTIPTGLVHGGLLTYEENLNAMNELLQRRRVLIRPSHQHTDRISEAHPDQLDEFPNVVSRTEQAELRHAHTLLGARNRMRRETGTVGPTGAVGTLDMVYENRRLGIADDRLLGGIFDAGMRMLEDRHALGREMWLRFHIYSADRTINVSIPFNTFRLPDRQDFLWFEDYAHSPLYLEAKQQFITYMLELLDSNTLREMVQRDQMHQNHSGTFTDDPEMQGENYQPLVITMDYVVPPQNLLMAPPDPLLLEGPEPFLMIENGPGQLLMIENGPMEEQYMDQDNGFDNLNGNDQDPQDAEEQARARRLNRLNRQLRTTMLNATPRRQNTQGVYFLRSTANAPTHTYHLRSRNRRRVGSYFGTIECFDFSGDYRKSVLEERDPCIYPPPEPLFRLSEHAKKRQKKRNRKVFPPVDSIVCTRYEEGMKVGAYELNNENEIGFYKESIEHIYHKKGVVHCTPETRSKSCFLMALIRCECFTYLFDSQKQYCGRQRSGGIGEEESEEILFTLRCTLPEWDQLQVNYSFVYYDEEEENYVIRWMNRFISYDEERQEYKKDLSQEEQYYWELAAREMELFLLTKNPDLDVNDMESVAQTVCDTFWICIQIYDANLFGERVWIFQPNRNIYQVLQQTGNKIHMASLLYDKGHMYGICHLMKYLSQEVQRTIDINAYCPFCEKKGTRELRQKASSLKHIQKCWNHYCRQYPCFHRYNTLEHEKKELEMGPLPIELRFSPKEKCKTYCCTYCYQPVPQQDYIHHQCPITCRKPKENLKKENLYVYDVEAAQIPITNVAGTYYHVCNMVCFRKMYPETEEEKKGKTYENEYEFMNDVCENYQNVVILAHNGGSYDHQFIVRYLERMKIQHEFIPSPNSAHKFLAVHVYEQNIQFLDFIYFLPGSLKNIAESMNIECGKGDFPHRFNTQKEVDYEGRIPPIDTEDDYWCLGSKRCQKDINELKEFYQQQTEIYCTCDPCLVLENHTCASCRKKTWVMKEIMQQYCMQDVVVLGECCRKYREQLLEMEEEQEGNNTFRDWNARNIDPFQFLTVPQLALNILVSGYDTSPFLNLKSKLRLGQCPQAIDWLEQIMREEGIHIHHRLNSTHEYYDYEIQQFADGYDAQTGKCYVCLDCSIWGCERCHSFEIHQDSLKMHPVFPSKNYQEVYEMTEGIKYQWESKGALVVRKCELENQALSLYEQKCYEMHPMSNYFYGGRTEVFQLYYSARASKDQKLQYHDVCSLYPYVCAFKELPNGTPQFILGMHIDSERLFHPDPQIKYWGYIHCRILPNPDCLIGFLPSRHPSGRLQFTLDEQDGCWGLNELELAWRQGYKILAVYGIIHWDPSQRSDQLFRPYVDFFLRMKQEAEGWKKLGARGNEPDEEEQLRLVEELFQSNGQIGRIRKEKVSKNPVKRMLAKLFLNSLWGKFAQKPETEIFGTVYGLKQFFQLWKNKQVIQSSIEFRQVSSEVFKVKYKMNEEYIRSNRRGNMALAAKVTEHARCELHKQMIKIGPERIIYCDTDSLVFHWPLEGEDLTGIGLGKWTNEYPNDTIWEFYAIAPKFYTLMLESGHTCLKVKGIQPTLQNVERLHRQKFRELIEDAVVISNSHKPRKQVEMSYMSIYANCQRNLGVNYGVMMTRYGVKAAKVVITKRKLIPLNYIDWNHLVQIKTLPWKNVE